MEEKSLSIAFADSLTEDAISCIGDYTEIGLDAVMDDGILKDIPIVSTAVAIYKIGSSIKERHNLKKLLVFIKELNNGIVDEKKRKEYQQKFKSNKKFRNQEIEYLLILIDRYISYDKPQMLAKLYLAYLDSGIKWDEFTQYAEVIDRLLPGDIMGNAENIRYSKRKESLQRLSSLGLTRELIPRMSGYAAVGGGVTINTPTTFDYEITLFGKKLIRILNRK